MEQNSIPRITPEYDDLELGFLDEENLQEEMEGFSLGEGDEEAGSFWGQQIFPL
ncbi:MAG: hypothetical protein H6Q73_2889 [Firmicutes bacterium]|nr:hypothetical protein [Bacillota bacterium]